jgi:glutathione reductase (NADPH)
MATYDYDLVVIGAGQGGLPAAHMAANLGAKVALIEMGEVGGA